MWSFATAPGSKKQVPYSKIAYFRRINRPPPNSFGGIVFYTSSIWKRNGRSIGPKWLYALSVSFYATLASFICASGTIVANMVANPSEGVSTTVDVLASMAFACFFVASVYFWIRDQLPVKVWWLTLMSFSLGYALERVVVTFRPTSQLTEVFVYGAISVAVLGTVRALVPFIRDREVMTFLIYVIGFCTTPIVAQYVLPLGQRSQHWMATPEAIVYLAWAVLVTIDTVRSAHIPRTQDNAIDSAIGIFTDLAVPNALMRRLTPTSA